MRKGAAFHCATRAEVLRWPGITSMNIEHIFISPGHNYFGHAGREPDQHPLVEQRSIECVAGRGLRGDRFFDFRENYSGPITFFSLEVFRDLEKHFGLLDKSPGVLRRNIIVSGIDLNSLIDVEFELQGIRFRGMNDCKPCFWMNRAFAPGAEEFLKGRSGLRAQILSDGTLSLGAANLVCQPALAE